MELTYPINLIGYDNDAINGDVLTRHGEYLGSWMFIKDEEKETGVFQFVADGESAPLFSEGVPFLSSGMLTGMAMSKLCASIIDWSDEPAPMES
ncbi:hypothetical protein [Sulfitobacter sp.]|uniref:hypothetical protein n=1 Tax=Sulfitobacter sp. TaxID=1903071 RepID=UPI003EF12224